MNNVDIFKKQVRTLYSKLHPDFLELIPDDVLISLFRSIFFIELLIKDLNCVALAHELCIIQGYLNNIIAEISLRGLDIRAIPLEIIVKLTKASTNGKAKSRSALKRWSFEKMMDFIDSSLIYSLDEAQHNALIDLAQEKKNISANNGKISKN